MESGAEDMDGDGIECREPTDAAPKWDAAELQPFPKKMDRKPFSIMLELDMVQFGLFVVALVSRLWRLDFPHAIVFDEVHFGRFALMYLERVFFFDVHPPLGKMLLAGMASLTGYDGQFKFDEIGSEYDPEFPVTSLRLLPAIAGSLLVPLVYQILVLMELSRWTAALAAVIVLCDNALLVQSRFMLLDGFLLFFLAVAIVAYLKFRQANQRCAFSSVWWGWLALLGLANTCALLTKYSGFLTGALLVILVIRDLWLVLPSKTLTDMSLVWHVLSRGLMLCVLPCVLYVSVFYIHLRLLHKAGPHDSTMTSAFQASLQGGLASITHGQPLVVAYGSQVTLRHTYGQPCWLHSHQHVYPIRYADKRGSSHQQQVTCYTYKDVNNWWIVKDPNRNTLMVDDPLRPVRNGDIIQLVHGISSRALNSHDVAAPMSPQHQEVSCYIDYNISVPAQNLWKVEIVNEAEVGRTWHTIESHIRLIHVNTSQALKSSGKQLSEWGFYQNEVVTDRLVNQEAAIWNVEEHRYTLSPDEEERTNDIHNADLIPLGPSHLSFASKFWELQVKMLTTRHDAELEHYYSSGPFEWPLMSRNMAYWVNTTSSAQIHLLGNPVLWASGTAAVIVYIALLVFYLLRRKRHCYDISQVEWREFVRLGQIFLSGYLVNLIAYTGVDRTLFLHHYLPAVLFKLLLTAGLLEHGFKVSRSSVARSLYLMFVSVWLTCAVNAFFTFLPFSYGSPALSQAGITSRTWLESWDFFQPKSMLFDEGVYEE